MPDFGNLENATVQKVIQWLEIRATHANDLVLDIGIGQLKVDAAKSALLKRLLDGKEPFPYRPPCSYSYPWYELLENGEGITNDLHAHDHCGLCTDSKPCNFELCPNDKPYLNINQELWTIIEKIPAPLTHPTGNDYIATYRGSQHEWMVSFAGYDNDMLEKLKSNSKFLLPTFHWAEKWLIKRLD